MQRMMADVPKADVVITNPTHFAIAIKYEEERLAPKIVAKGRDLVAQRIKEIARESNVRMIENKPLAKALYKSAEVGDWIPEEYWLAVAEILAFVYEQDKRKRGALTV